MEASLLGLGFCQHGTGLQWESDEGGHVCRTSIPEDQDQDQSGSWLQNLGSIAGAEHLLVMRESLRLGLIQGKGN